LSDRLSPDNLSEIHIDSQYDLGDASSHVEQTSAVYDKPGHMKILDAIVERYNDRRMFTIVGIMSAIMVIIYVVFVLGHPEIISSNLFSCGLGLFRFKPSTILALLIVIVDGGIIGFRVIHSHDTYGIRTELLLSVVLGIIPFIVSLVLLGVTSTVPSMKSYSHKTYDGFVLFNSVLFFGTILCQLVSINWPILRIWNEHTKHLRSYNALSAQSANATNPHCMSLSPQHLPSYEHVATSRSAAWSTMYGRNRISDFSQVNYPKHFIRTLSDPLELSAFRKYCVSSFSVAACLFYERISAIHRRYGLDGSGSSIPIHQLSQYLDEMNAIYRDFLAPNAKLSLSGTLSKVTEYNLLKAFLNREMSPALLNNAMAEVKNYLYLWVYPKYLEALYRLE
jgi:hypothetical protein